MKADLVSVVEAAYRIEESEDIWLKGVLGAARSAIDGGLGAVSYTYDASDPDTFRINSFVTEGLSDELAAFFIQSNFLLDPDYVRRSFLSLPCGTSRDTAGWHEQANVESLGPDLGVRDFVTINGLNPDGHGCAITAPLRKPLTLTGRRRDVLTKLSCHLAAAHRLRQRLASLQGRADLAEAVLDHDGNIHDAVGEARSSAALSRLKRSTLAIVRSRGALRADDPEQAVDEWKGLIAARWTLVDVCETDGRRYLVARRNHPRTQGPAGLTRREEEVVAYAAMGHHNKSIAYNLGISHSTVRVLIARASAKLGVSSRDELGHRGRELHPAAGS